MLKIVQKLSRPDRSDVEKCYWKLRCILWRSAEVAGLDILLRDIEAYHVEKFSVEFLGCNEELREAVSQAAA